MPLAPVKNRSRSRESDKNKLLKRAYRWLAVLVVLTVSMVGAGILLMWLMQPKVPDSPAVVAPVIQKPDITSPRKFGPNVPIGSAVQSISSPIAPGNNASVTLRTTEGATCSIKVVRLDTHGKELERIEDSGLVDKKVDVFGVATWTWTIPNGTVLGVWQADMFCTRDDMSTRSVGELVIQAKE